MDKTLTWFMRMWGAFVDIWRERRRLRLQLHHDEAMTIALQKMIEATNWLYVAVLTTLVFFSTLIGALLSFKRTFRTAVLSALLFVAGFIFWTYYPHGLPLPTSITAEKAPDFSPPRRTTFSAPMRSRRPNGVLFCCRRRFSSSSLAATKPASVRRTLL